MVPIFHRTAKCALLDKLEHLLSHQPPKTSPPLHILNLIYHTPSYTLLDPTPITFDKAFGGVLGVKAHNSSRVSVSVYQSKFVGNYASSYQVVRT